MNAFLLKFCFKGTKNSISVIVNWESISSAHGNPDSDSWLEYWEIFGNLTEVIRSAKSLIVSKSSKPWTGGKR